MPTRLTDRTLDLEAAQIVTDAGEVQDLTAQEVGLLAYLQAHSGRLVPWDELQREVWGHAEAVQSRAAYHAWRRLAPKIEPDPSVPRHVEAPRGGLRWPKAEPPATGLVGREAVLARLIPRVAAPGVITLWGPAGVGKSALARAVAAAVAPRATEVELTGLTRPEELEEALALDRLGTQGPWLVVLDPVDGLTAELRSRLEDWRAGAPDACFLATGRTPIGVPAEQVVPVEPLDPAAAVALLRDRIDAAGGPPVGDAEARALVDALDRLPLALELCAPWARTLTPAQLLEALERRLDLLSDGRPAGAPGAISLRAALDQSWALLPEPEQDVLAQLAVFHGPFSLEAAGAIVQTEAWLPGALRALVDASLLQRAPDGALSMLLGVRDRVLEHHAPPPEVRDRHLTWLAETGEGTIPDLVAAATHGLSQGALEAALTCCRAGARRMRMVRGPQTAIGWLTDVLQRDDLPSRWRARLQLDLGASLGSAERYAEAVEAYDEAVTLAEADGEPELCASALTGRGLARGWLRQTAAALRDLDAAAALTDQPARIALNRAVVLGHAEDTEAAIAAFELAAERARLDADPRTEGVAAMNQAVLWLDLDHPLRALPHAEHAVALLTAVGGPTHTNALNTLGLALQGVGRVDDARRQLQTSLALATSLGLPAHRARALSNLGELETDPERGAALQREALRVARAGHALPEVAAALVRLARHLVDTDRGTLAEPLLAEARALAGGPARRVDWVRELEALLSRVPRADPD